MKAPDFWWRPRPGRRATLLAPVGLLYGAVTASRMARPGRDIGVPVLCVGNLVAGGAGKTPTAIALAKLLLAEGHHPTFVSRGFGRRPGRERWLAVDPALHGAAEAGDEPLLLARTAPTFVGADRLATAQAAVADGADVVILDDGLQNPALLKSWTVAVVDGASGFGNGLCVPAGPLRAPVDRQWPHVSMVCIVGDGGPGDSVAARAEAARVPVTRASLRPDATVIAGWRGKRLVAAAGIGRPEKFFATLKAEGLDVAATHAFPDHHRFTPDDLRRLAQAADGALLVTTAKDRVRMPAAFAAAVLPVDLVFAEPARVRAALPLSL